MADPDRFCGFCGSRILGNAQTCSDCGAKQPEVIEVATETQRFCGFCGTPISLEAAHCPECGKLQPGMRSNSRQKPEALVQPRRATDAAAPIPIRRPVATPPQPVARPPSQVPSSRPAQNQQANPVQKVGQQQVRPFQVQVPKAQQPPIRRAPQPAAVQRAAESEQILIVRNLSVVKSKKTIVEGIDFSVMRGEIVGILGPSGSGKSTILKVLTTESSGASGTVIMGGYDLGSQAQQAKQLFGYVPQDIQLYEDMTFGQNVMYFGSQYGLDKSYLVEKANQLASVVELGDRLNQRVSSLSGGQKKRASVATALAHDPELVILDEPTSGLDPSTRRSLWKFLKSTNQVFKVTMLVTTHYLDEGEYCDKLLIINKGHMIAYDSPRNLRAIIPGAGKAIELEMFTLDDYVSAKLGEFEKRAKQNGVAELVDRSGYKVKVFCKDIPTAMARIPILLGELGLGFKAMNVVDTSLEDVFIYFTGEAFQEVE